ncbi:MAG: hypothetical protein WCF25_06755 [Acidimicrobiales bacterium]
MSNLPPLPTRPGPLPELPNGRGEGSRFGVVVVTAVVTCVVVLGAAYVFVEHHARTADPPTRTGRLASTTATRPPTTPTTVPHRAAPTTTTTLTPKTTHPSVTTTTTVAPTTTTTSTTLPPSTGTSISPVHHRIEVFVSAASSGNDAVEVSVVVQSDAPVVSVTLYGSGPTGTMQRAFTVRPVHGVATYEVSIGTQLPFTVYAGASSSSGDAISRTETVE